MVSVTRSEAWTVLARSKTGIVGWNLEAWMSVCVYSVSVVLYVGRGLATGRSPVQGVLCVGSRNWKSSQCPTKGCRAVIIIIIIIVETEILRSGKLKAFVVVLWTHYALNRTCLLSIGLSVTFHTTVEVLNFARRCKVFKTVCEEYRLFTLISFCASNSVKHSIPKRSVWSVLQERRRE
jgi:hypothetical protein